MSAPAFETRVRQALYAGRRWHPAEIAFWLLAAAACLLFPRQWLLLNEIAILALFALSLDLILGFAGIVSLGHAAFLGMGAYAAGLLAKHVTADPLAGLSVGMAAAGLLGLVTSPLVLRGTDLTRLMITLGVALILYELANSFGSLTGGADGLQGIMMGPVLGLFDFDIFGRTAYLYSLSVLFVLFLIARRVTNSPFGLSLRAIRDNPLRASASGVPNAKRLAAVYALAAAYAGAAGALLA
jgi:branched-chain amino acid transport system permease protein